MEIALCKIWYYWTDQILFLFDNVETFIEFPLLIVKYIIYLSQPLIDRQKQALYDLWK